MSVESSALAAFVSSMGQDRSLKVEENLGEGYVRLRVAEAERRQAKHDVRCIEDVAIEMLRNSRDAGASHICVAVTKDGDLRRLTILDDGSGVPADMQERIFEPRVTSKLESVHMDKWGVHGRGMALYSIRENVVSARVARSAPGLGCAIEVVSDPALLSERADQSTWPTVAPGEDGEPVCAKGPHNIVRTCCEFALEERGRCEVYFGSPSEIAATARARASAAAEGSFGEPVLHLLRSAASAAELREVAESLGLPMSGRTAHRVVSGEVKPLPSVLTALKVPQQPAGAREVDLVRNRRGLRISAEDAAEFSEALERDFALLADRYFLELTSAPRIKVSGGRLTATFDFDQGD